jgi:hypothetical protein
VANRVAVIVWRNVLVLCDDGRSVVSDYAELFEIGDELHRHYPDGWGLLIIIPPNAVPPSEPVRNAINDTLTHAQATLKAVSWTIEGGGFQGATARAVLTGMRFLTRTPYARNICRSIEESLEWLLPQLPGPEHANDVTDASSYIASRRDALSRFQSAIRTAPPKAASSAE